MKNQIIKLLLVILMLPFVLSCTNNEKQTQAFADAYIIKRQSGEAEKYALSFFVSANKELVSVTVKHENSVFNLEESPDNNFLFLKEPAINDFVPGRPDLGEYLFEIYTADDELNQISDEVTYEGLFIPQFEKLEYDSDTKVLSVSWGPVPNADGFAVKISRINGTVIYVSYSLDFDATEYQISSSFGNWLETPYIGSNYMIEIHAFAYEDDYPDGEEVFNLKEISIGTQEFIWGQ